MFTKSVMTAIEYGITKNSINDRKVQTVTFQFRIKRGLI